MSQKKIKYKPGKEPHPNERRMIFKNVDRSDWDTSIKTYINNDGYSIARKALTKNTPEKLKQEVFDSGVRGRGGAGFPVGLKWRFLPKDSKKPIYLICNADESEPGTFKDRYVIYQDPHQLLEGMIISAYAVGANLSYIYIREEFCQGAIILENAIAEAKEKNFLGKNIFGTNFDLDIFVHRGAGAYICGEENGLIESLEGKRAYPRIKPPYFPAALGLYMCPTIVNNVESLCHVKHIIEMGGKEYSKIGIKNNTGTRIISISGDVEKPGYFEIELGKLTLGEVINDMCGGIKNGNKLKGIIPGGSSAKILKAESTYEIKDKDGKVNKINLLDIKMDFDSLAAAGSMAGSGGIIVIDDTRSISWVLENICKFYAHESCGQCTPCREGSLWMQKISTRLANGKASPEDVETLDAIARQVDGRTICAFGEACSWPVEAIIANYREELIAETKPENADKVFNRETLLAMSGLDANADKP